MNCKEKNKMTGFFGFCLVVLSAIIINVLGSSLTLIDSTSDNYDSDYSNKSSPYFIKVNTDRHHGKIPHLKMDKALLIVESKIGINTTIHAQTDVCWKCPLLDVGDIPSSTNISCVVDTRFAVRIVIKTNTTEPEQICSLHEKLEEHGHYCLYINPDNDQKYKCNFYTSVSPPDSYIPIYVTLAVMVTLALIWILIKYLYRKLSHSPSPRMDSLSRRGWFARITGCWETERLVSSDLGTPTTVTPSDGSVSQEIVIKKERLRSLDAFRGLSIVVMIFVNYGGGGYWFFHHSAWNGLTVADLVFPWFTFIMGTSAALSFRAMLRKGIRRPNLFLKIVKRTVILFVFGIMISNPGHHGLVDVEQLRIPGVLQRLAATYFVVAFAELFFARTHDPHQHTWWKVMRDLLTFWPEWVINLSLLLVYLCLTFLLPLDYNCPRGYIGPGGLHDGGKYENCTGGAAGVIDNWVFGEDRLYLHPTCKIPYQTTIPYDPEGILGTITSIFICFLGLQAGKILITFDDWVQRTVRWLIWAAVTGLIAGILCKFSQNDGWIPVNKNLWSLSFVLALASMAFLILTVFYLLIDVFKIWSGAPLLYPGMNAIVVYLCHELLHGVFPVQFKVPKTHASLIGLHVYGAALWTIVSAVMYYKKVFISI